MGWTDALVALILISILLIQFFEIKLRVKPAVEIEFSLGKFTYEIRPFQDFEDAEIGDRR